MKYSEKEEHHTSLGVELNAKFISSIFILKKSILVNTVEQTHNIIHSLFQITSAMMKATSFRRLQLGLSQP